jgi:hypothetical protein
MPSPLKIVELCQKPIFASYFGGAVIRKIFYPLLGHPLELSRPSTPQWIPPRKPFLALHTLDPSPIGVKLRGKISMNLAGTPLY